MQWLKSEEGEGTNGNVSRSQTGTGNVETVATVTAQRGGRHAHAVPAHGTLAAPYYSPPPPVTPVLSLRARPLHAPECHETKRQLFIERPKNEKQQEPQHSQSNQCELRTLRRTLSKADPHRAPCLLPTDRRHVQHLCKPLCQGWIHRKRTHSPPGFLTTTWQVCGTLSRLSKFRTGSRLFNFNNASQCKRTSSTSRLHSPVPDKGRALKASTHRLRANQHSSHGAASSNA